MEAEAEPLDKRLRRVAEENVEEFQRRLRTGRGALRGETRNRYGMLTDHILKEVIKAHAEDGFTLEQMQRWSNASRHKFDDALLPLWFNVFRQEFPAKLEGWATPDGQVRQDGKQRLDAITPDHLRDDRTLWKRAVEYMVRQSFGQGKKMPFQFGDDREPQYMVAAFLLVALRDYMVSIQTDGCVVTHYRKDAQSDYLYEGSFASPPGLRAKEAESVPGTNRFFIIVWQKQQKLLQCWDGNQLVKTIPLQSSFAVKYGSYQQLSVSPDGEHVAYSDLGDLNVLHVPTGRNTKLPIFLARNESVDGFVMTNSYCIALINMGRMEQHNVFTGNVVHATPFSMDFVSIFKAVASPKSDSEVVFLVSTFGNVVAWRAGEVPQIMRSTMRRLRNGDERIKAVAVCPNGRTIVAFFERSKVVALDIDDINSSPFEIATYSIAGENWAPTSMVISDDSRYVYLPNYKDGYARRFAITTHLVGQCLDCGSNDLQALLVSAQDHHSVYCIDCCPQRK